MPFSPVPISQARWNESFVTALQQRAFVLDHKGGSRVVTDVTNTDVRVTADDAYTCLCIHHKGSVTLEHLYMAMRI